ncbi:MAG: hypothetical protein M1814_000817 [Vezdaea aestivalis]|nr:MAG: hypothetical protein M1814_000817 [Vezdaea aestivalis]
MRFRGLMRRDKITTIKRKALDGRTAGSTSFTHPEERITAQMMRQKGVHISIDTSSFKDDHQYGTFSDWVGTIMHESCHAVIEIFQCTCDACNATFVAEIGQGGHGTAWTELATAVVERARKSRRLKDTGGDHVRMHHHLHDPTAGMAGIGGQAYGGIFAGGTYDGSPYGGNPYGGNPYGGNPYGGNPYGGSPYGGSPYGRSPHGGSPYGGSPYGGRSGFL